VFSDRAGELLRPAGVREERLAVHPKGMDTDRLDLPHRRDHGRTRQLAGGSKVVGVPSTGPVGTEKNVEAAEAGGLVRPQGCVLLIVAMAPAGSLMASSATRVGGGGDEADCAQAGGCCAHRGLSADGRW